MVREVPGPAGRAPETGSGSRLREGFLHPAAEFQAGKPILRGEKCRRPGGLTPPASRAGLRLLTLAVFPEALGVAWPHIEAGARKTRGKLGLLERKNEEAPGQGLTGGGGPGLMLPGSNKRNPAKDSNDDPANPARN